MSVGVQGVAGVDGLRDGTVFSGQNLSSGNPLVEDKVSGSKYNISDTVQSLNSTLQNGVTDLLRTVLSETISSVRGSNPLQNDFTTNSFLSDIHSNSTSPEVTFSQQEVTSGVVIGTAEKVIIGAAVIVVVLAVIAITLRLCCPYLRSRDKSNLDDSDTEKSLPSIESFSSKLSGIANLGADISSASSGIGSTPSQDCSRSTGSTPVSDWSEFSSDNAKSDNRSTDGSEEMAEKRMSRPKVDFQGFPSMTSLPVYHREESLEPARFEQSYRDRWDDQWDPQCSMPRGNLSHLSHPSESRLSLNTLNSVTSSSTSYPSASTFPIPSREFVRQLYTDNERRYPSNAKAQAPQKKEKQERMSPADDRNN